MKIEDILYFSPKYKFSELKWDDKGYLLNAFKDRVNGFYLDPAKKLNKDKSGFATGVMCVTTIDFLSRIDIGTDKVGKRIAEWLMANIEEFKEADPDARGQTLATRFYDEFRNGLVHEGRIKNAGQFSYNLKELVKIVKSVMVVNPEFLLNSIDTSFKKYIDKIEKDKCAFQNFKCALLRDFRKDVEYVNRS